MQVVNLTPEVEEARASTLKRWQLVAKYGSRWYREQKAQDEVVELLRSLLDNRYLLIRGLKSDGQSTPLPPLLVGPSGAYLLAVWPNAGFYRIREEYWEVMQRNSRRYRLAKPNIVRTALDQAKAAEQFLEKVLGERVPVKPIMVFTNPGVDIDPVNPAVKPLLIDGLKRYFARLAKDSEVVLTPKQVLRVFEAVSSRKSAAPERPKKKTRPKKRRSSKTLKKVERYFNFTPRQWAILGILATITLCVSIGVVFYLLYANTVY